MRKKSISILSALAITASSFIFSGCESKNDNHGLDAENPITITIWHYYNGVQQTYFDNMVNQFNETVGAENGIIVEAYTKSGINELAESVMSAFDEKVGADEVPDIFASYSETAFVVEKMGKTANLNDYFTDEEKSQYIDGYIDEGCFSDDGNFTIFPVAKSTEVMTLNVTDWKEFAESESLTYDDISTWEKLAETAEKYYDYTDSLTPDIENDGKSFFGRDSIANYMIVGAKQLGSEIFVSENGNAKINADKELIRKLWDCYYVPYVKGCFSAKGRYRSDDIKVGNIICAVNSTTGVSYLPNEVTIDDNYTYPIETVVLPVPYFENCEKKYTVQQGAGMVVAKSDETHEYASAMFLKWFTESDRNIEFSVGSGYLPVKKDANNKEKIDEIVSNLENKPNSIMMSTIEIAVNSLSDSIPYSMKPFESIESARNFAGTFIQDTADSAYNEACEKIKKGGNREEILRQYTDDNAFEKWYNDFLNNFSETVN